MKIALIGHRGVGKSSFLKRLRNYGGVPSSSEFVDLDKEIENVVGDSIPKIFSLHGESYFRKMEVETFARVNQQDCPGDFLVVALGAGFLGQIPEDWVVIWVQRSIDSSLSQFVDRPNLDGDGRISSERFQQRERRYNKLCHYVFHLREHESDSCEYENLFFQSTLTKENLKFPANTVITLTPENINFLSFQKVMVEVRDDIWDITNPKLKVFFQQRRVLLSFRCLEKVEETQRYLEYCQLWDWPIEFGTCPFGTPSLRSLHEKGKTIEEAISRVSTSSGPVKLAIPIESFKELFEGEKWRSKDPTHRSFLPISKGGRWRWYRRLMLGAQPVNFLRMSKNNYLDQPLWYEGLQKKWNGSFAALLGDPVNHSLTPWFHEKFFSKRNMPVVAVKIEIQEWSDGIRLLEVMGLKNAAVTSPLKKRAGEMVNSSGPINTLKKVGSLWLGKNTDIDGAIEFFKDIKSESIAVWGGGGVLDSIYHSLPRAQQYSSRTGKARKQLISMEAKAPEILIWAVGAKNFNKQGEWPPKDWKIKRVYDINYDQESPGLSYASNNKLEYRGGLGFFKAQAKFQQNFWSDDVSK